MPGYEFRCSLCGKLETLFRKVKERDEEATCLCGAPLLRQQSAPSASVKGGTPKFHRRQTG